MQVWKCARGLAQWSALAACFVGAGNLPAVAQQASELPDSPSATLPALQESTTSQQNSTSQTSANQSDQNAPPTEPPAQPQNAQQHSAQQSQTPPQRPVGTAAAEAAHAGGVAASQPAGVAIAPAKQHRVRTIVLKIGAIVGAGVAVGTVVALSEATPSKPPGAH
jgi:hypothetical protein